MDVVPVAEEAPEVRVCTTRKMIKRAATIPPPHRPPRLRRAICACRATAWRRSCRCCSRAWRRATFDPSRADEGAALCSVVGFIWLVRVARVPDECLPRDLGRVLMAPLYLSVVFALCV